MSELSVARTDILTELNKVLETARAKYTDPSLYAHASFEALATFAGVQAANALGNGVPFAEVQESLMRSLLVGMDSGIDCHEQECHDPDCGYRERVETVIVLLAAPIAGEA